MRNLKKILALVLALVMSMSLVTIANASDFTDSSDITYEEAADVMNAIGIIEGFEDGSFDPDGTLTREQAATLVTRMLLGDNADRLGIESSTFDDVAVTRWSAPYIEYCASLGLIDGAGDGNFYPAATLTGYEFAKILLTAIGYDSQAEGLVGTSWSVNTAALAMDVGLDEGMENGISSAYLTREEAAQMALNAIKTPLVAYEEGVTIVVDGTPVSFGSGDAYYVTTTLAREQRIGKDTLSNTNENTYTVEFGERYFPNLRLVDETDEFMRPSHTWVYENEELGTYVDYETREGYYTTAVEYGELYDLLGRTVIANYDLYAYVDGVEDTSFDFDQLTRNNSNDAGSTDRGVLTEVFVDHDKEEVTITSINTYLAQALTDYNETTGRLSIAVYTGRNNSNSVRSETKRLDDEDFAEIVNYSEDDFLMVTMADGVVQTIDTPEVVSDVYVSAYSSTPDDGANNDNDEDRLTRVTADGEDYRISAKAYYDPAYLYDYSDNSQQLDGYTYDLLLDPYGNLLGIENVTDDENFFFVVGYEYGSSLLSQTVDQALVIFPDGTMQVVDAMEKDNSGLTIPQSGYVNAWYNYTVNSNNVYVISGLTDRQYAESRATGDSGVIDSSHTTIETRLDVAGTSVPTYVYGNSDSVYITVEADDSVGLTGGYDSIVDVRGVTTGIRNTSIEPETGVYRNNATSYTYNVFGLYNSQGYVTYAIVVGDDGAVAENLIYLTSGITGSYYDSETQQYIYQYDAITSDSDEIVTVESTTRVDTGASQLRAHNLYTASYDADGFIDGMELMTSNNTGTGAVYNTEAYQDEGYGLMDVTSASGSGTGRQQVVLSGAVLYLNASNNDQYVVLDEDVRFFVNGQDDDDGEYNLYPTASSALAALGEGNEVTATGKIVIIADPVTGFGTTIIFLDAVYEETGTSAPGSGWTQVTTGGVTYSYTNPVDGAGLVYVGSNNVTVAQLYNALTAGNSTQTISGGYYTTDTNGIRTYHALSSTDTVTIASVLAADDGNITITNDYAAWTIVNER